MPDRETVITHLQIVHTWAEFARERDLQFFTANHLEDIAQWADDALELLKEYQEKQEGLPPTWQDRTQEHVCQKCGGIVWQEDNYCSKCGQAVKWE